MKRNWENYFFENVEIQKSSSSLNGKPKIVNGLFTQTLDARTYKHHHFMERWLLILLLVLFVVETETCSIKDYTIWLSLELSMGPSPAWENKRLFDLARAGTRLNILLICYICAQSCIYILMISGTVAHAAN